jgi:hypothetical protein
LNSKEQKRLMPLLIITAGLVLFLQCKEGHPKDTVTSEELQTIIDASDSGDTITIPAGHHTWTSKVTIPDNKKIILTGAGMDNTFIVSDFSYEVINMGSSGSRITNLGFKLRNDNGYGINVSGNGWRIDHCRFDFTGSSDYTIEGVRACGDNTHINPAGVIDHCEFNNIRIVVYGSLNVMANEIWAEPLGLGTNNAVFVEDNVFRRAYSNRTAIDSSYGGRYVFRYNTVHNAQIMAHSAQENDRAVRSWEVYNNTIIQEDISQWVPFFMRGGTGVIFNNTVTGSWDAHGIALDNRRSCEDLGDGGLADGTSLWDGNEDATGYPARDQIGRSTDNWLWTEANPYPPQALDPAYCWNNTYNSAAMGFFVHTGTCDNNLNHIQENRDYFNNTVKSGYTPYTYPRPLTQE